MKPLTSTVQIIINNFREVCNKTVNNRTLLRARAACCWVVPAAAGAGQGEGRGTTARPTGHRKVNHCVVQTQIKELLDLCLSELMNPLIS